MTERSHATRRTARSIDCDFPAMPTLAHADWCDGMAFVLRPCAAAPDLRPIREAVRAMWRGTPGPADDAPELFLVAFVAPMRVDAARWPSALPLVASRGAALTSFAQAGDAPAGEARTSTTETRRLELWWGGRAHRIAVDTLEPLPIASLWEMPRVAVHRPAVRVRVAASGVPATGAAAEGPVHRLAQVSRAEVPIDADGADLLRDMVARLNDAEQRIRFSSILKQAFGRLFSTRTLGEGGGGQPGAGQGRPQPRQPGLLDNLAGWFRWHTPFGASLRNQFGERLGLVEKLLASGDLDGALRLALKLGRDNPENKPRSRYPGQLPGMRARLDFEMSNDSFTAPIFAGSTYYAMRARYLQLAEQLEKDGDFHRAAYIHSQLLGDHRRAVLVLEKGKLFREAAKLAIDSKQEAPLAIRMFFLAGDTEAALALAKRTACFDQLAEESRDKDPAFHAYVVKAWTDMLLATGQPLRALQVTDHLADAADEDYALLGTRRSWLRAALAVDEGEGFDSELAVRAILTAHWNGDDLSADGIGAFPFVAAAGSGPHAAILTWFQSIVRGEAEDGARTMLNLLGHFARLGAPNHAEQAAFWKAPAQPVVEGFARALIATASSSLSSADLQTLRRVLNHADLRVLEADIGKLTKLHVAARRPDPEWQVPPVAAVKPAVKCACLLGNGNMLIWRENRLLQLLDRDGTSLWQQNISDVTALVAIGTSPNVILIQSQRDGASLLTRFASHSRAFHPIGKVALAAHHDLTSESQWLVQIGGEIGALDLVKLCAPEPRIEFLWSCSLTDRLQVIAFSQSSNGPGWVTRDVSRDRGGVLEIWSLHSNGHLTTRICLPVAPAELSRPIAPEDWCWFAQQSYDRMLATGPDSGRKPMFVSMWTEQQEDMARTFAATRARARIAEFDTVQSCDLNRPYMALASGAGISLVEPHTGTPLMTLKQGGDIALTCLAREAFDASSKPGTVLMADAQGRLFVIGLRDRRVTVL